MGPSRTECEYIYHCTYPRFWFLEHCALRRAQGVFLRLPVLAQVPVVLVAGCDVLPCLQCFDGGLAPVKVLVLGVVFGAFDEAKELLVLLEDEAALDAVSDELA